MGEELPRGHSRPGNADMSGESGWITTEVAAKAVRVSPRTIRRYIERGELEAKPEGEGVNRTWLISVDSLHALRASRTLEEESPQNVRVEDSMADVFRDLAARLEQRAAEAAELRTRLELTEQTQTTLEVEHQRAREELAEERRRREDAERELDGIRRELEVLRGPRETPQTGRAEGTFKVIDARPDRTGAQEAPGAPQSGWEDLRGPPEPEGSRDSPETPAEGSEPTPAAGGAQEDSERPERSWRERVRGLRRRILG
jgi:hypothetical protein